MKNIHALTEEAAMTDRAPSGSFRGYYSNLVGNKAGDGKTRVRSMVYDLFFETGKENGALRAMTLPGPWWTIENRLLDHFGPQACHFTSFEKDLTIMHKGLPNVPRRYLDRHRQTGHWERLEQFKADVFATNTAQWLNLDFRDWALLMRRDFPSDRAHEAWLSRFWNVNAVWLDFTSQLHGRLDSAVSRLPHLLQPKEGDEIAVVVTVLEGREDKATLRNIEIFGGREFYLQQLLRHRPGFEFHLDEVFRYVDSAPMLTVFGRWTRK